MNKQAVYTMIRQAAQSKVFKIVTYACGTLVLASFIFQAGVIVGFSKASYGRDWGDNYVKNFGPVGKYSALKSLPENFPNAHGTIGTVIMRDPSHIIVEDKDGTEKSVIVTKDTQIRKMREVGTQDDLQADASVVIIGVPNEQGQIEAKLIRVLPRASVDTELNIKH